MNAIERIREAKKLERKLGLTIYDQKTDTTTGNEVLVPRVSIGLPAGSSPMETGTTIALCMAAIWGGYTAGEFFLKGELSRDKDVQKRRRRKALFGSAVAAGSIATLLPVPIDAGRIPLFDGARNKPRINGNYGYDPVLT